MNDADPGWRPALRPIWTFLVPWFALLVSKRRLDLIGIRRVFLHVGITLIEVAIVISSTFVDHLATRHGRGPSSESARLVASAG